MLLLLKFHRLHTIFYCLCCCCYPCCSCDWKLTTMGWLDFNLRAIVGQAEEDSVSCISFLFNKTEHWKTAQTTRIGPTTPWTSCFKVHPKFIDQLLTNNFKVLDSETKYFFITYFNRQDTINYHPVVQIKGREITSTELRTSKNSESNIDFIRISKITLIPTDGNTFSMIFPTFLM